VIGVLRGVGWWMAGLGVRVCRLAGQPGGPVRPAAVNRAVAVPGELR
jgi:hypothetical protein